MNACLFTEKDRIAQGNTAEIYPFGDGKIIKLFRDGIAPDAVRREYDYTCAAARKLPEVPAAYDLVEYGGRCGIIFRKVAGDDMMRLMLAHPLKLGSFIKDFAAYHAKINTPVPDTMRTVTEKLRDEIGWETELSDHEKRLVTDHLSRLPEGACLCHGDFHPGNVMINGREVFFLDWMTACRGDPCADAARTYLLLRYGEPMHIPRLQLLIVKTLLRPGSRIYLHEYCRLTGLPKNRVTQWMLPVAAARLSEWLTDSERKKLAGLVRRRLRVKAGNERKRSE